MSVERKSLSDLTDQQLETIRVFSRGCTKLETCLLIQTMKILDSKVYLQKHIKNRPVVRERNSFKRNPFNTILFLKNKTEQQLKKGITSRAVYVLIVFSSQPRKQEYNEINKDTTATTQVVFSRNFNIVSFVVAFAALSLVQ